MQIHILEGLLRYEAEAKAFLGITDRAYEQILFAELLQIMEEAESLFGPRDRSYELLPPRITECACAHPFVYPFRKVRIYLTKEATNRALASHFLAHETIHVLNPANSWATALEEGLGMWFCNAYTDRVHGFHFRSPNRWYEAALRALTPLMAKNKFVIKELRSRQPVISKIDKELLMEVAGADLEVAEFLCAPFDSSWLTAPTWGEYGAQSAKIFAEGFRSFWDERKS